MLDDKKGLPTNHSWVMQVLDDYLYVSTIDGVWRTAIAGLPDPVNATQGAITTYKPKREITVIEGAVSELTTRERVSGAVVTAVGGPRADVLQTVTDNQGRYRFDAVDPGIYVVSAYYNIGGRGQIEVRRSGIEVEPAHGVIVPIWVELSKQ